MRAAVKEELQDMLNEAIKVASKPTLDTKVQNVGYMKKEEKTGSSLQDLVEQTRSEMTNEEYKNVFNGNSSMVQKPNFASMMANNMGMVEDSRPTVGLDITKFDFVKKAGEVYKASVAKDKEKYGVV